MPFLLYPVLCVSEENKKFPVNCKEIDETFLENREKKIYCVGYCSSHARLFAKNRTDSFGTKITCIERIRNLILTPYGPESKNPMSLQTKRAYLKLCTEKLQIKEFGP